jgi:hypothetical protein
MRVMLHIYEFGLQEGLSCITLPNYPLLLQVYLNGSKLPVKSFTDYCDLYLGPKENGVPRVYEKVNDRWEVCISATDGQFQQVRRLMLSLNIFAWQSFPGRGKCKLYAGILEVKVNIYSRHWPAETVAYKFLQQGPLVRVVYAGGVHHCCLKKALDEMKDGLAHCTYSACHLLF